MLCALISFVLGFALTFFYGKKQMSQATTTIEDKTNEDTPDASVTQQAGETIATPVTGQTVALGTVNDPVFSSEMMGKGIGILPQSNEVYAPADGTLTVVYGTKHAYGITTKQGTELLIHIGIDTVNLAGQHFTTNKQSGEQVKKGELLGTFDREAIQAAGYDTTVLVIVTNTNDFSDVRAHEELNVTNGQEIIQTIS